ncbi:S-adenosyl-L-methionine-dependent methyltransferase [Mycena alexandri]|uniref:S-adenosyl-L-methionine-dependent methyltransferase n=1 Tax=Mycena alexandri TaxID=1745969 RepID=A0AAD6TEJ5_9AGAR|nr:S-adenosyl-L-methionine-dependent methyltransferase [Mycena alexandri]
MTAQYTHGHHDSVLRSHSWRTAQNSCAYLLSSLTPNMHILDVGCGPGTITADLAKLVPAGHVTGIERSVEDVLQKARDHAAAQGVINITYAIDDVLALSFPDNSFDVVHAHQVLQHVSDPILALKEMLRVAKPGGIVAARDTDFEAMTWFPESKGIALWRKTHQQVARSNGGEPDAGRRMLSWALAAGLPKAQITASASTWCYSTPEEIAWWTSTWADRVLSSEFATSALERGFATQQDLDAMSQGWKTWSSQPDAWFGLLHGEILCHKV